MIHVELDETCDKNRICVKFPYARNDVLLVREIPGRTYVKGAKHWHVPLDLETCRQLRVQYGKRLEVGAALRGWASGALRLERTLGGISASLTANLSRLPVAMPELYKAIHLGPLGKHMTEAERIEALKGPASYQAADVEFLVQSPTPLNGNEQGTGKTIEWIGAIWEAGIEEGNHIVVCPKTAIDGTWEGELAKWQAERDDVEVFACVDNRESRETTIAAWQRSKARVKWLIVNPAMIMYQKDDTRLSPLVLAVKGKRAEERACYCGAHKNAHEHYTRPYPEITDIRWRSVCIDEAHKAAVRNHKSLTAKSFKDLQISNDGKCCLMSGTPMKKLGGVDLWGMLHYLNPKQFSSFWRFAEGYYEIHDNGFGKRVGKLRAEKEDALFRSLIPFMLRRTKKEVAPWLPDKLYVEVPCRMTPRQERQYRKMEKESAVFLGNSEVMATGTLDKIVRLKQFANGHCKVDTNGDIVPIDSPKVDAMIDKMHEVGMFEEGSERKQLVFSQSRRMVNYAAERLREAGLKVETFSGGTSSANRKRIINEFQNGDLQVIVIVTTAGGVSLTLDAADEVHLIDEMWSPDEDAQAEDRAHRVSRIHQVTVFIYRSIGTIDEDISMVKIDKAESHELILDIRRRLLERYVR